MKGPILLLAIAFSVLFAGCSVEEALVGEVSLTSSEARVSKAEFDLIENGMTYEEVAAIIGGEGELSVESGEPGSEFHTVVCLYDGDGDRGANANFTFQGGKLMLKAQAGLR